MPKKQKRVWSDDQRRAASERMKIRHDAKKRSVAEGQVAVKERPPEIQAIIDTMTPERKAKLAMVQSRFLSTQEGQKALERHEAEKASGTSEAPFSEGIKFVPIDYQLPPSRVGSREVSLIVKTDGTMVSQYGPCLCGKAKREWHKICLKEVSNGQ